MRGLIDLDTETLRSIADAMASANEDIDAATSILRSITQHGDWNCRERDSINEQILENAEKAKSLRERSNSLLRAIRFTVEDVVSTEEDIGSMFQGVEEILARIGATPVESITRNITDAAVRIKESIASRAVPISGPVRGGLASVVSSVDQINLWDISEF